MTGRDKQEMIIRANHVSTVLKGYDLTPISPVIEEGITNEPGQLVQSSEEQLKYFWQRDKHIISDVAHVVLCDEANRKSFGMEREYGFARYCLWKPVVSIMNGSGYTVAEFEDDIVCESVQAAAAYIQCHWGTAWKRRKWRIKMLIRTLPKFLYRQLMAWR